MEIGGNKIKPARELRIGETLTVKLPDITKTFNVLGLLDKRVGASLVPDFLQDLTPAAEYERAKERAQNSLGGRPKGAGRPTKKERRIWERFQKS